MENKDMIVLREEIPKVLYQEAVEAMGFIKGYVDGSDHPFSERFRDAINVTSQFVEENHPQITMCINTSITEEELLNTIKGRG